MHRTKNTCAKSDSRDWGSVTVEPGSEVTGEGPEGIKKLKRNGTSSNVSYLTSYRVVIGKLKEGEQKLSETLGEEERNLRRWLPKQKYASVTSNQSHP